MSLQRPISDAVSAAAQGEVERIVRDVQGVIVAVISTLDGFEVASAMRGKSDPARVAAMSSSIFAISDVVADEACLGRQNSVIIQAQSGFAIFCGVPRRDVELVVNVVAGEEAVLALSLYRAVEVARKLARA